MHPSIMQIHRWCPKTHTIAFHKPILMIDQSAVSLHVRKKNTRMDGITTHHGTYAVANLLCPVVARITNISFLVPIYTYMYKYSLSLFFFFLTSSLPLGVRTSLSSKSCGQQTQLSSRLYSISRLEYGSEKLVETRVRG